jgi:hypothetical protein
MLLSFGIFIRFHKHSMVVMDNGYLVVGTVVGMDGSELLASRDVPYGNRPP